MLIIKLEALGASVKRQSGPCMNVWALIFGHHNTRASFCQSGTFRAWRPHLYSRALLELSRQHDYTRHERLTLCSLWTLHSQGVIAAEGEAHKGEAHKDRLSPTAPRFLSNSNVDTSEQVKQWNVKGSIKSSTAADDVCQKWILVSPFSMFAVAQAPKPFVNSRIINFYAPVQEWDDTNMMQSHPTHRCLWTRNSTGSWWWNNAVQTLQMLLAGCCAQTLTGEVRRFIAQDNRGDPSSCSGGWVECALWAYGGENGKVSKKGAQPNQ